MNDVLSTINDTTLEALGFKPIGSAGHSEPHQPRPDITTGYRIGALTVYLHSDGGVTMALHDRLTELTFEEVKQIAIGYRPANV